MSDLYLDPLTNDLAIIGGDVQLVTGREAVRQQIMLRLSLQKGEWPLDIRAGVDWRGQIMVRNPDLQAIAAIFRQRILSTPEVIRLASFSLTFNNVTGLFSLAFIAITKDGEVALTAQGEDIMALIKLTLLNTLGNI
jgi:hypothetical protein